MLQLELKRLIRPSFLLGVLFGLVPVVLIAMGLANVQNGKSITGVLEMSAWLNVLAVATLTTLKLGLLTLGVDWKTSVEIFLNPWFLGLGFFINFSVGWCLGYLVEKFNGGVESNCNAGEE